MFERISVFLAAVAAALVLSTNCPGQEGPPKPAATGPAASAPDQADIAQLLADLKKDVQALKDEMVTARQVQDMIDAAAKKAPTDGALVPLPAAAGSGTSNGPLAPLPLPESAGPVTRAEFNQLWNHVRSLHAYLDWIKDNVNDNQAILNDIAINVSEKPDQKMYALNVKGNMAKSQTFRTDMSQAVDQSIRRQGTLRINNKTTSGRTMRVYGKGDYYIPPMTSVDVPVPTGTLSAELLGQEGPKNWTVSPPTYLQEIDILPAATPYVAVDQYWPY